MRMKKQLRPVFIFTFISLLSVSGIFIGFLTTHSVRAIAADRYQELQLFTKVLNIVQKYYVEDVDLRKLLEGGIKGMLKELDPHTNYLPPDIYREFENETSGEFGGLGIEITVRKGLLTIISPIEDTPAWKAGIKSGDKVLEVNGTSTKGLSLVESAQLMRGKLGESVDLKIMRTGFDEPKVFKIVRGTVKIKSVKFTDLENGYGYFRITSFIENTSKDFKRHLEKFKKKNSEIKGFVIDLRQNPGGLLDQAVKLSDIFLDKGIIVSTIGRDEKKREVLRAKEKGSHMGFPVIVLINEYSASASEIFAGAMKDNKRALIMGRRSFGKGSVQSVIKLGDGSGLKLTVARYYTPSGRSIQAKGIDPDVVIDRIDADVIEKAVLKKGKILREKDIDGHLAADKKKQKKSGEQTFLSWRKRVKDKKGKNLTSKEKLLSQDYQALQAYNYLKAWGVIKSF